MSSQEAVTEGLVKLREGNQSSAKWLQQKVYAELRRLAHNQRQRWQGDPSLRTTALVHEAYLKLVRQEEQSWESRAHFFAVAATAMRHILINRAERHRAEKRGGDTPILSLEALRESLNRKQATADEQSEMLVLLDAALECFEETHSRAARVVECRFFGGMTIEETAEVLGVSTSTVSRDWDLAQAWLYREMKRIHEGGADPDTDASE